MPAAFVTGAQGAIGSHVCRRLLEQGWRVGGIGHGDGRWPHEPVIDFWLAADVDAAGMARLASQFGPADLVVHLAGGSSVAAAAEDPAKDYQRTVGSTSAILDWMVRQDTMPKLAYASSAAVYGEACGREHREDDTCQPVSVYGRHKLLAEQLIREAGARHGVEASIVRLFSVYGPGLRKQLVYSLCKLLHGGARRIELSGTGDEMRDWLFIEDAADLLIASHEWASANAPVVNGSSGVYTSVAGICQLLADQVEEDVQIAFTEESRPGDPVDLIGSPKRMLAHGFKPRTPLPSGIAETFCAVASGELAVNR